MKVEQETKTVKVFYPQEDELMRWDESIESIAKECKGECQGGGTGTRSNERDLEYLFGSEEQAAHFVKRIKLFSGTVYDKNKEQ